MRRCDLLLMNLGRSLGIRWVQQHMAPHHYAEMLRKLSVGLQAPVSAVSCPVSLVSGEWDEKYTAYYQSLGDVHHVVPVASHAVVLQRPDAIAEIIQNLD